MKQNFAAIILGGTGEVGGAAVAELLAIPECREVVMVTRGPLQRECATSFSIPALLIYRSVHLGRKRQDQGWSQNVPSAAANIYLA